MRTRGFLGWVAMATMVLSTGCSNDEVVNDYSPENAIQFDTYLGRNAEARGTEITTQTLGTEAFGVFAYYTGNSNFNASTDSPNFMYNQKVENTGTWDATNGSFSSEWSYTPVKYWPNNEGDKVTFLAYAPYYDGKQLNSGSNTSLTFNIPNSDITKQEDILYLCQGDGESDTHKTINLTKQSVTGKVEFHFLHACSRIGFNAEVMVDQVNDDKTGDDDDATTSNGDLASETKITIEEIELIGKFYSVGTLDLTNGVWTPTSSTSNYNFKLAASTSNLQNNVFDGAADDDTNADEDADVSKRQVNKDDSYLMIIPQDFASEETTLTSGNGIKVRVKYTVETTDEKLSGGKSTITNNITSEEFKFKFEQGKAYTFNLHLGMTSVKLSAEVAVWNEVTPGTVVNVPINKN